MLSPEYMRMWMEEVQIIRNQKNMKDMTAEEMQTAQEMERRMPTAKSVLGWDIRDEPQRPEDAMPNATSATSAWNATLCDADFSDIKDKSVKASGSCQKLSGKPNAQVDGDMSSISSKVDVTNADPTEASSSGANSYNIQAWLGTLCRNDQETSGEAELPIHGSTVASVSSRSSLFDNGSDSASYSSQSSVDVPEFRLDLLEEFKSNCALLPSARLVWEKEAAHFVDLCSDLFRRFSGDLRRLASSPLQKGAAKVVRNAARFLAINLASHFECDTVNMMSRRSDQQIEQMLQRYEANTVSLERLEEVRTFLFEGRPFNDLVKRLERAARQPEEALDVKGKSKLVCPS